MRPPGRPLDPRRGLGALLVVGALLVAPGAAAEEDEAVIAPRLQAALRRYGADVHGCYGLALAQRGDTRGEVLMRLFVAPSGAVERADVLKDQTGSGRLTECLTAAMRGWKLPELAGAQTAQLVFPLAFAPDNGRPAAPAGPAMAPQPASPVNGALPSTTPAAAPTERAVFHGRDGLPGPLPGGKLDARVLIDEASAPGSRASLTRLLLRPSTRLALHKHPGAIEMLYVVRGLARLRTDGGSQVTLAETGDLIIADPGAAHSIEAAPLAPLELLQIFVPGGPERAYRDRSAVGGTVAATKRRPGAPPDPAAPPPSTVVKAATVKTYPLLGGKASVTLFLDGRLVPSSLQRFEAAPGAVVPLHSHDDSDEIVFIVAGKGEMTVGGAAYAVETGDAIRLAQGRRHGLTVTEKLVAVLCYAPAGPEQRFKGAAPLPAKTETKP